MMVDQVLGLGLVRVALPLTGMQRQGSNGIHVNDAQTAFDVETIAWPVESRHVLYDGAT